MANNLIKLRGKYGIGQTELANRIGVSKQCISANEKKLSLAIARKVADYFENENIVDILGQDALRYVPQTEEEKEKLIAVIQNIEIK